MEEENMRGFSRAFTEEKENIARTPLKVIAERRRGRRKLRRIF